MTRRVELIFDFVSPNAYLAWWPLREIIRRTGSELDIYPVFLGGMHKLTGNAPPMVRDAEIKGKNEYAMLEMRRFIAKHDLDRFRMNPAFPFNSIALQRMLFAADQDGRGVQMVEALLPPIWEQEMDVNDMQAVRAALEAAKLDADDLIERAQTEEVKQGLIENTANAVTRGAFGIPTMFVGEEMFFGKERLGQIEEELEKG
ncbi:2-hydroxychromene-2-carboxylate isomerase [Altererythrobacter sp.]|uniref:2-hydroxychromene-2-carboxylate isomerase n=1 Tax=Altererythrobacter sp. TaxID=1872480 RepID=UPI003CFD8F4B